VKWRYTLTRAIIGFLLKLYECSIGGVKNGIQAKICQLLDKVSSYTGPGDLLTTRSYKAFLLHVNSCACC